MRYCNDCGNPEWYGPEESGDIYSLCTCDNKRVSCDLCGHRFLPKDMGINNMFLALCYTCNEDEPYLLDTVTWGEFKSSPNRNLSMLGVEQIENKLQLTLRLYRKGVSIIFPGMEPTALLEHWVRSETEHPLPTVEDILFETAITRCVPDYISQELFDRYRHKRVHTIELNKDISI